MTKLYNFKRDLERVTERVFELQINVENKESLIKFKEFLNSEGIGYAKITKYLQQLIKIESLLNKRFVDANESDIRRVVSQINQEDYSEATKRDYRLVLRRFYCFLFKVKKKGQYPEQVEWISLHTPNNHKKLPEELLTEEETKLIIHNGENTRDRALLSTLGESGARISEIGNLQIKHISFEQYGTRLTIHGKTGSRKILVISSTPYLQEWVNQHPNNKSPEAYLWYNPRGELLSYAGIKSILKKSAKRAGIKKRVHPHLLRHSRATQLASSLTEAQMKQYLGWTQSSKMCGIYIHMSGKETDDAILRTHGLEKPKETTISVMQPKKCLRCKTENEATNVCCKICGLILDEKYAKDVFKDEARRTQADEFMNFIFEDEEIKSLMKKKAEQYKSNLI